MRLKRLIIFIFFLFHSQYFFQPVENFTSFNIDSNQIKKYVEVLGSDLFEGRGTGSRGGELAANYITSIYKKIGLVPLNNDSSFFQDIPLHGTNYLNESRLYFYKNDEEIDLHVGTDYLLSNFGEQTIIPKATEIVFVGYGIIAPEFDHNDYLEKNVEGKIVLMLSGEPNSNRYDFFNGDEPTIYSYADVKHRVAISRGAAGTIIIPQMKINDEVSWQKLINEYSFEDVKLSYNASDSFGIILNPEIARKLFVRENKNSTLTISPEEIDTKDLLLRFEGEFFVRDFKSHNVIGMIPGNLIDKEYLIISAHYDHLGIGPSINGDKIYNGVLDNAIGVAALLEIARELKTKETLLNRSIIFIATTGEEYGLLGSSYYVDHPMVPLYQTVANINIDGLAYIDEFNGIIGIGSELSNLGNYFQNTANKLNLSIEKIPKEFYSNEAFNRSDQIAFAKAGIPSIVILDSPNFKNIDEETAIQKILFYQEKLYHTPFDDLKIKINYKAAIQHTEIITSFIYQIAISDEEIMWNKNVPFNYIRLQTKAEKR